MKLIQLAFRQIIHTESTAQWERHVFEDSYYELLMQFQLFDQEKKYTTFTSLLANRPEAEKMHFLVSAAVTGHIAPLGKIPRLENTLGQTFLPFNQYRFEIIESDISHKKSHRVAVIFYSNSLVLHEVISDHLLISPASDDNNTGKKIAPTELVKLQTGLSIYSIQYHQYATSVTGNHFLS